MPTITKPQLTFHKGPTNVTVTVEMDIGFTPEEMQLRKDNLVYRVGGVLKDIDDFGLYDKNPYVIPNRRDLPFRSLPLNTGSSASSSEHVVLTMDGPTSTFNVDPSPGDWEEFRAEVFVSAQETASIGLTANARSYDVGMQMG